MINIAIIDDHSMVRAGIKKMVELHGECTVCLEASNGADFFGKLPLTMTPDIVVLDLNMPVMNGMETLRQLKQRCPQTRPIVYSMLEGEDSIIHMLNGGVCAFVNKSAEPEELVKIIVAVYYKGVYTQNLSAKIISALKSKQKIHPGFNGLEHLTIREIEFINLSSKDISYTEIAKKMGLSVKTVENYRDRIFVKLGVSNRNGLTLYAIQNGLADPFSS